MNTTYILKFYTILFAAIVLALFPLPVLAGTPDDSYTIERYYEESEVESTTTSINWQTKVTITFTPPATKDFLVIANAFVNNSSTSYHTEVQLLIDSTAYAINQFTPYDTASSNNYHAFAAHKVISLTGGSAHTIKLQYRTENAAGTAYIKNTHIAALEVGNYNTQVSEGVTDVTSSNQYETILTLTFTPDSSTDYLILATADETGEGQVQNKDTFVHLTYDGAEWGEHHRNPVVNLEYFAYGLMRKLTGDGSSHDLIIQCKAQGAPDAHIKNVRITSVKLTDLDSTGTVQYAESETESTNSTTTYSTKVSKTFTPSQPGNYLVIASAKVHPRSKGYSIFAKLDIDSTESGEHIYLQSCQMGDDWASFFAIERTFLDATSHTLSIQWKSGTATRNTSITNARIMVIRLNTLESYNDSDHTTVDNTFAGTETTGYIWGHGFTPGTANYKVAWYEADTDGAGTGDYATKVETDTINGSDYGQISSQCIFSNYEGLTDAGTWYAIVFDSSYSAPSTYDPSWVYTIASDNFTVEASVIPEFPSALASIAVLGLCTVVYLWLRRQATLPHLLATQTPPCS